MANINYNFVKFLRGNVSEFNALEKKDSDTLYFVYEEDSDVGQLWIGDRLITEHVDKDKAIDKLEELIDVEVNNVSDKQILSWNKEKKKWVPINISSSGLIETLIGATETSDGKTGLVPAPKKEDKDSFLRGDGTWGLPDSLSPQGEAKIQEKINEKASIEEVIKVKTDVVDLAALLNNQIVKVETIEDQLKTIESDVDNIKQSIQWINL